MVAKGRSRAQSQAQKPRGKSRPTVPRTVTVETTFIERMFALLDEYTVREGRMSDVNTFLEAVWYGRATEGCGPDGRLQMVPRWLPIPADEPYLAGRNARRRDFEAIFVALGRDRVNELRKTGQQNQKDRAEDRRQKLSDQAALELRTMIERNPKELAPKLAAFEGKKEARLHYDIARKALGTTRAVRIKKV